MLQANEFHQVGQHSSGRLQRSFERALLSLMTHAQGEEPETLEMNQMVFQAQAYQELLTEGWRAGVNSLLSNPNGPGLCCF